MIELEASSQQKLIEDYQKELNCALSATFESQFGNLISAGKLLRETLVAGNQIFLLGNGGSSSQCNHAEADFYYWKERDAAHAIQGSIRSLSANSDALTAFANDHGEISLFSIQLKNTCQSGDAVLAISTSGNSANICDALNTAKRLGLSKVGLLGRDGGQAMNHLDIGIIVKGSEDTNIIQDIHSSLCHILLKLIMTQT
jgi:D-sedoheptulose 7-phosphate isomerase